MWCVCGVTVVTNDNKGMPHFMQTPGVEVQRPNKDNFYAYSTVPCRGSLLRVTVGRSIARCMQWQLLKQPMFFFSGGVSVKIVWCENVRVMCVCVTTKGETFFVVCTFGMD